jgi:hypothetical protein
MVLLAFLIIMALLFVSYAVMLWRDPTLLYRTDWFSRQTWGWLEGRRELRSAALICSALSLIAAATALYLAFMAP